MIGESIHTNRNLVTALTIVVNFRTSAAKFLEDLQPFFDKISKLRKTVSLMNPLGHEKIRIAVLDSGADDTDSMIRPAINCGRINASKSKNFVGQTHEWRQDFYGHGTHVTRLLLKTAPAAEIYVGKICTGKMINDKCLPGIAQVGGALSCDTNTQNVVFEY